jgi:hypothetical protein
LVLPFFFCSCCLRFSRSAAAASAAAACKSATAAAAAGAGDQTAAAAAAADHSCSPPGPDQLPTRLAVEPPSAALPADHANNRYTNQAEEAPQVPGMLQAASDCYIY